MCYLPMPAVTGSERSSADTVYARVRSFNARWGPKGKQVQADASQGLIQEFDPEFQVIPLCLVEAYIALMVCGVLCCPGPAQEMACEWDDETC